MSIKDIMLEDDAYVVTLATGLIEKKTTHVRVNAKDAHILRQILGIFDESLGRTTFVHFERERMHILIFYIRDLIFCVTCERSLEALRLAELSNT